MQIPNRAPTHIHVNFLTLGLKNIQRFGDYYFDWIKADKVEKK